MVLYLGYAALGLLGLLIVVAFLWGLHKLCLRLEREGYLYYRKKPEGGGGTAGAMLEMERLIRPSVEHVNQVHEQQSDLRLDRSDGE